MHLFWPKIQFLCQFVQSRFSIGFALRLVPHNDENYVDKHFCTTFCAQGTSERVLP